jgi:ATP-dependent RNA/DNA helicase IGHMBP2
MDYFKKLKALLAKEKEADKQAYVRLTSSASAQARRDAGMTWYPIAIRGTEIGKGDYLTVEVERTTHQDITHQLRSGAEAALFSNHDAANDRIEGTISFVGGDRLKLSLRVDELPDWTRDGKLGIDLLFDDKSYEEMEGALTRASELAEKAQEGRLVRILTGAAAPKAEPSATSPDSTPDTAPHTAPDTSPDTPADEGIGLSSQLADRPTSHATRIANLNPSQSEAVQKMLDGSEITIVHGPPGTGKTTTLVQAIKRLAPKGRILVVAPSNTAVDLLSEKLSTEGLNVVRIGNPARVSAKLTSLTLDARMAEHAATKQMKKLRKQAAEFRDMAHKYKRNFGSAEREQRKALFDEAKKIMKEVDGTEQYVIKDILDKAQVVAATLVGSANYSIRDLRYHTLVIDEAGQALEPACWVPIVKAERVVLAGDHLQLPPTIKSEGAGKEGLGNTLLEKTVALYPARVTLLEEQYRMNEVIMGFSSREFYGGKLKADASVAHQTLFPGDAPLEFVDTAGCGFEETAEGTIIRNPEEAAFLFKHLEQLVASLEADRAPSIAIIAPYRGQVQLLEDLLHQHPELKKYKGSIAVNTIDGFQGQERDVVYIGLTRSNADQKIGFLSEIRRMNVAMTRAKKKLVVIGDSSTLSQLAFYADFIAYAEENDAYKSAWEYMG